MSLSHWVPLNLPSKHLDADAVAEMKTRNGALNAMERTLELQQAKAKSKPKLITSTGPFVVESAIKQPAELETQFIEFNADRCVFRLVTMHANIAELCAASAVHQSRVGAPDPIGEGLSIIAALLVVDAHALKTDAVYHFYTVDPDCVFLPLLRKILSYFNKTFPGVRVQHLHPLPAEVADLVGDGYHLLSAPAGRVFTDAVS